MKIGDVFTEYEEIDGVIKEIEYEVVDVIKQENGVKVTVSKQKGMLN